MMRDALIQSTEVASYFLWEYTNHTNAIDMWYCTEDICFYLERQSILKPEDMHSLVRLPKYSQNYIEFIRNISYRIFLATKDNDELKNWYTTERLLANYEWYHAVTSISSHYRTIREGKDNLIDTIRTEWIKKHLV